MKGYIVFIFSVTMCEFLCVCKLFFFIRDFSGTNSLRILKYGTNVGYDLLYCVKENRPPGTYHSLYLHMFLSLQSNFLSQIPFFPVFKYQKFSPHVSQTKLKLDTHVDSGLIYDVY